MRTRTPPATYRQLDTTHTVCNAAGCDTAAIHGPLCYRHTHHSRQLLAGEHRRLQHTHGALTRIARVIRDLLATNVDLTQPAAGGRWKRDLARALTTLDRLIDPPTQR